MAEIVTREVYTRSAQQFVRETPEFDAKNKANCDIMQQAIIDAGLPPTVSNFKAIYTELKKAGQIKPRPSVSTSLSDRHTHEPTDPESVPSDLDKHLSSMSLEDARTEVLKLMQRAGR